MKEKAGVSAGTLDSEINEVVVVGRVELEVEDVTEGVVVRIATELIAKYENSVARVTSDRKK